ncbi:hypothetical protein MCAMS1_00100 [biofilm metagenome]
MKYRKTILKVPLMLTLLVLGIIFQPVFATQITTSVDRNPVKMDESFKIFFAAADAPDGDPDLTPLEQDFTVINQSQSTSTSWVNGNYNKSIRWTVEVTANKAGKLVIPAILFGNDTSEPLTVTVTQDEPNNNTADSNEDVFLDVKAMPEQPYVQSQVIYTIRLYRRVDMAQAELNEPELADAVIEKLGEDSNFNTIVNGVSYVVTERKYAIFPQKSGLMTIKPLTLTAAIIVDGQLDFRDFFSSRMTKTKRVLSKEVTLNVKPVPAEFKGKDWLAAEKLELTQEWSGDTQQMKIGEPLTRTLTLRGEGTTVGQLPELNTVKTDTDIKAYPDQPVLNEQKQPDGIAASRQEKIALIPAKAGKHSLPAIEIPWYNIKTQKVEIVRLPGMTINVIGVAGNQPEAPVQPKIANTPIGQKPVTELGLSTGLTEINKDWQQNPWLWTSAILAMGWLITLVYFLTKRPKQSLTMRKDAGIKGSDDAMLKKAINNLKLACAEDDAQAAKTALLDWGKLTFAADNLATLAAYCDTRLCDEILLLNQYLYGKNKNFWQGKHLMRAFKDNKASEKKINKDEIILEPLHRL